VNQLRFHPLSRLDVSEAIDWYQARSLRAAEQFALEVERVIERIAENPEQFTAFDGEIRRALLPRFPYSVLFVKQQESVFILTFAHAKRRPGFWRLRNH
jgi:plasmid stabilization system protein ParE